MKNIYLTTLLLGAIGLSGCGSGGGGSRHSSETISYGKWLKPSKSICENNGGEYNTNNRQECRADLVTAEEICSLSGGILPTIAQLKQVVLDCGGEIYSPPLGDYNITKRNQANSSYQACYKEKGFSSGIYQSSDTHSYATYDVWQINYSTGSLLLTNEDINTNIRCVKKVQYSNTKEI